MIYPLPTLLLSLLLALLISQCEATSRSLESFCSERPAGLYCHPENGKQRVYCPEESPTTLGSSVSPTPFLVPCPSRHVCRSHRKLHFTDDDDDMESGDHHSPAHHQHLRESHRHGQEPDSLIDDDHLLVHYPQCVFAEYTDLDGFCEDKIHEFVKGRRSSTQSMSPLDGPASGSSAAGMASHLDSLRQRYSGLLSPLRSQASTRESTERLLKNLLDKSKSSQNPMDAWDEVLLAVRQCNPFSAERKQVLDCVVVQRECGVDLKEALDAASVSYRSSSGGFPPNVLPWILISLIFPYLTIAFLPQKTLINGPSNCQHKLAFLPRRSSYL